MSISHHQALESFDNVAVSEPLKLNLKWFNGTKGFGFVVPGKTPDPIVAKLAQEVAAVLAMPEVKAKLTTMGMELAPQTPAEFDRYVAAEFSKWAKVMKAAGIEPN